jgi:4-amino-4-deoxy-L-arabinose transferase-like glycosyltransferase
MDRAGGPSEPQGGGTAGTPRGDWREAMALAAVVLVAVLPFLGKAFHIDDVLYLAVARQILREPLDPYGAQITWEKEPESLFDADFNPPLWNYLMAAVMAVAGESEIALHLLEGVFVAGAAVAMYGLSRRYVRWPLAATSLLVLSPAMLPGLNVMLEAPTMAFWLGAAWCHLRAVEQKAGRWVLASGLFVALAVLTKYTSGLLIVILAAYSVQKRDWRSLWFIVLPALALAAWSLHSYGVYGRAHPLIILSRAQTGERHSMGFSAHESFGRAFATTRAFGAVTVLAVPGLRLLRSRGRGWTLGAVLLGAAVGVAGLWDMRARLDDRGQKLRADLPLYCDPRLHAVAFGLLGTVALGGVVAGSWPRSGATAAGRSSGLASHWLVGALGLLGLSFLGSGGCRDWTTPLREWDPTLNVALIVVFLGLTAAALRVPAPRPEHQPAARQADEPLLWVWLGAVILFGLFAVPFLAVRHLLPGIPVLIWLTLMPLAPVGGRPARAGTWCVWSTTVLTAVLGFALAHADYNFANWYRHVAIKRGGAAVELGRPTGNRVWFVGHWGWQYYAERAGMHPLPSDLSLLRDGDLLLEPLILWYHAIPRELQPYLKRGTPPVQPRSWNPLRTVATEVHYYAGGTLNLPWQLSDRVLDDFLVMIVQGKPEGPLPPSVVPGQARR